MSRPNNDKSKIIARCVFCNRPGVDHAHIWPKWVRKQFTKGVRVQSIALNRGLIGNLVYTHKRFEGAVDTKTARRVCPSCNRGWMRDVDNAAEEVGTKLIQGKEVLLNRKEQTTIASFISLSALLIDLVARVGVRTPQSYYEYFYINKIPAPNWYVGIGHFTEIPRVSVDIAPSDQLMKDKTAISAHSISTTLGALFTALQFFDPIGPPAMVALPVQINRPYLAPIWPHLDEPIRFPSRLFPITGGLWQGVRQNPMGIPQDGGLARELSRRFPRAAYDLLSRNAL